MYQLYAYNLFCCSWITEEVGDALLKESRCPVFHFTPLTGEQTMPGCFLCINANDTRALLMLFSLIFAKYANYTSATVQRLHGKDPDIPLHPGWCVL